MISVAVKTPLKRRFGICIYKTSLLHRPDGHVGFTPSCPPTFYDKIAPMYVHMHMHLPISNQGFWYLAKTGLLNQFPLVPYASFRLGNNLPKCQAIFEANLYLRPELCTVLDMAQASLAIQVFVTLSRSKNFANFAK